MHQPLSVALGDVGTEVQAVDLGVVGIEAGVPLAHAQGARSVERGLVELVVAEAGGTDHGAVATGQAARRHVFEARVLEVLVQELGKAAGVEAPLHLLRAGI